MKVENEDIERTKKYCKSRNIEFCKYFENDNWICSGLRGIVLYQLVLDTEGLELDDIDNVLFIIIDDHLEKVKKHLNLKSISKISIKENEDYFYIKE